MNNLLEDLKKYFRDTPDEQIQKDWSESEKYDEIGPSVEEFIKETQSFFKLEQDKLLNKQLREYLNIQPGVTFGFLI